MTTPNLPAPDSAYVVGEKFAREHTAATVKDTIANPARAGLDKAVDGWGQFRRKQAVTWADHFDGQTSLRNRADLIKAASGHCSAFMGYNWDVPPSKWVVAPFDTALGPTKRAVVDPATNGIVLKAGGLWRVDVHATMSGYTMNQTIIPIISPPYFTVVTTYNPILPQYNIEIVNADGTLYTARRFHAVANMSFEQSGLGGVNYPQSSAFSHTFVLDNMPTEDDPAAPNHWKTVRLGIAYTPVNNGTFNSAYCSIRGGTRLSSMIASRWARNVENINYRPEVPAGGTLG
ncbi:hypothetical protein F5X71_29785 [Nocardia brasiliensis]|uniref:Uncharacterized protein n=1 Tax=Nocardia brasiliensis TaxID=37326 RepID=A0A6G9XYC4_NOCBR|nr:hypothetical protein [Nocardia brasiliensis]QIS05942.1 hypothetical protein F5X71_29785 [Nocardia brasiliensis]